MILSEGLAWLCFDCTGPRSSGGHRGGEERWILSGDSPKDLLQGSGLTFLLLLSSAVYLPESKEVAHQSVTSMNTV